MLKPGGELIFTDPMKADDCPEGVLGPILERIHLETLGCSRFYRETAGAFGLEERRVEDRTPHLVRHYTRVLEETERLAPELEGKVSDAYLARMKKGLRHRIDGGRRGYLARGVFCFRVPAHGA